MGYFFLLLFVLLAGFMLLTVLWQLAVLALRLFGVHIKWTPRHSLQRLANWLESSEGDLD